MEEMVWAAVFPGQGCQVFGMAKDIYDEVKEGREIFEKSSEALSWDAAKMCFEGDFRLDLTSFAQPMILTAEIAILAALKALFGFSPVLFGGHSLGEYAALVAAGVMPFECAVKLVHLRGKLMQEACPEGVGGMAAVIADGLDIKSVEDALEGLPLDAANENSPGQIVISGQLSAFSEAEHRLREIFENNGGFRFVRLNVSAPFHSRFMEPVTHPFFVELSESAKGWDRAAAKAVTSNATGFFHDPDSLPLEKSLTHQLVKPVRWKSNMSEILKKTGNIIEIGPARPLSRFFKAMGAEILGVTGMASARRTFSNGRAAA